MGARRGKGLTVNLGSWLAGLACDELLAVLRARPEVRLPPEPRDLGELAIRLTTPHSLHAALGSLTQAGLLLVEAVCALGEDANRQRVHELFGGPSALPPARLADELEALRRLALVWPSGERLTVPGALRMLLSSSLSLGRSAHELLDELTVAQLRQIGERYGLSGLPRKADWVAEIAAASTDPSTVRRLLAGCSPEVRELVEQVAWHGPRAGGVFLPSSHQRVPAGCPGVEAALYGWVVPAQWGQVGEMPLEIALVIRGGEDHPRLPPRPSIPAGQPLHPGRLLDAARGAASAAVDGVARLLALLGRTPLACVQTGGVGVRELRRAAKQLRSREHEARLWLETAASAQLVTVQNGELLPTAEADAWTRAEPAAALATLLTAWWELALTPTHRVDEAGKQQPAMGGRAIGGGSRELRADLLDTLAGLGESTGATDFDAVIDLLVWRRPLIYGTAESLGPFAVAARAEARAFGLVTDDALTPLGTALLAAEQASDPCPALIAAIADLLPPPTRVATFLPDLTAVVAGSAAVELAALLDDCADVESRDVASTWRFSPASVRRALDCGHGAEGLLGELAAVADKPLPQPLTYLVHDVARRHGQLRVHPVSCCVCVKDPALAAEVVRHRSLAPLTLVRLGDTVLASSKSVTETLSALRAAGYAPVRHDAGGAAVLERTAPRRAKPPPRAPQRGQQRGRSPAGGSRPAAATLEELAARLHRAGHSPAPAAPAGRGREVSPEVLFGLSLHDIDSIADLFEAPPPRSPRSGRRPGS